MSRTGFLSGTGSGGGAGFDFFAAQIFLAREIDAGGEEHADAGGGEAVVPAPDFAERADNERRGDDAGIDAEVENLEGVRAAQVLGFIERTDLAGDVALEHPATEDQAKEREEKEGFERHQEMAGRHGERAEKNRAAPAENAIGEEAAEDRREINTRGVGAEDGGGERLAIQAAIEPAESVERGDVFDPPGEQEILDHVKDEQRLHPVIGKSFPRLGEGEIPKPARMAEE